MAKQRIGSIRQKILVEGDPNLLNENEILVIEDSDNAGEIMLKQLDADHRINTMVLIKADKYISSLEDAYKQGSKEVIDTLSS